MNTENLNQEEQQAPPSKEEVIKFFQEQIEVKKVQYELQELNTKLAAARAEELKALSFIAQLTNPKIDENAYAGQPHTLTEEDIANNPELVEQGLKAGDEVIIPDQLVSKKERTLKKQ